MTQVTIIGCYLLLLLALGVGSSLLSRGTSKDYMLASHSIGPFLLLMSLFGTTMTAFALVGSTGEAYAEGVGVYGLLASSSGIIHSLCFLVLGVKLWSLGARYNYTTQIQYFRDRLDSSHIGLLLFPILVGWVIPYLLIGVIGAGGVINGVTRGAFPGLFADTALASANGGVPHWLASLVICVVVLVYVFFGGMRGTAWANTFQTIVFMVLGIVTFVVIATEIGGKESIWESMRVASEAVSEDKLTRTHFSKTMFLTYMFSPLSVGMFPHLFQHWLTARSANSFKLAVVAHPIFIMIVWAPCVLIGVWATTSLAGVPPTIRPNAVLGFLVQKLAGEVLGGFLTAGVLAAIMSSLDSQFLCVGTMFTEDIMLHYGGKNRFTDKQVVMMARGFIILIVAVTYCISLYEQPRVFQLGIWCFSGFASLFPLIFSALYWKRLTKAGAYAGILAACGTWCYLFQQSEYARIGNYTIKLKLGAGTYELMPVTAMIAACTLAIVVVSLVTRPPSRERVARFFPEVAAADA